MVSHTLLSKLFGQTIKAVGQCFGLIGSWDDLIVLFLLSKSFAVPVFLMIAES
jgi:hypothetical protein